MRDGFKSTVNPGTVRLMGTANYHGSQLLGGSGICMPGFTYSEGVALADPAKFLRIWLHTVLMPQLITGIHFQSQCKGFHRLQGIKTNQFELGYRINYAGIKGQVSGFISKSDKNLRNTGIEAEVSYTYDGFYIGASALLIRSEVEVENDWKKQEKIQESEYFFNSKIWREIEQPNGENQPSGKSDDDNEDDMAVLFEKNDYKSSSLVIFNHKGEGLLIKDYENELPVINSFKAGSRIYMDEAKLVPAPAPD
ncbi:hypothetical protein FQR65_LT19466 [Abscondita terminalis]|nr:hypothetical protein FQR65_LT19466 [Abscondita terminalis]